TFISMSQKNNATVLRAQYELRDEQEKHRYYSLLLADIDPSVSPTLDREVIQQELKRCEEKISDLSERLYLYQSDMPLKSHMKQPTKRNTKQVDSGQLRQQLAPDQLLLAYFLYKGKLVIFAARTEGVIS